MTVSDQIIKVLDNLCEKFGLAIDWTSENVIPYLTTLCDKLVSYEIWTSVAWLTILLVGFLVAILLIRKCWRNSNSFDHEVILGIGIPVGGTLGSLGIAAIISQIMDIIKCVTFPEMYIFEYIQNMINSAH